MNVNGLRSQNFLMLRVDDHNYRLNAKYKPQVKLKLEAYPEKNYYSVIFSLMKMALNEV